MRGFARSSLAAARTIGHVGAIALLAALSIAAAHAVAEEVPPQRVVEPLGSSGPRLGVFSDRTLVVGVEVDRDGANLVAYTAKTRPYVASLEIDPPREHDRGSTVQLEVALLQGAGLRHTRRVDAGPLCLDHDRRSAPHVAGDTIRMHRDAVVFELPEIAGFDRIEIAYYEEQRGNTLRRPLGVFPLDGAHFIAAGADLTYADLAIAGRHSAVFRSRPQSVEVLWPEDFGDTDMYRVYGDVAEGDRRINVVIVPDGYTHAEKALMETHADDMVAHFRSKTPSAEHDPFINYILVYAYSLESGTDECDCGIERDTAMGTRFPQANPQCGHSDNRCLYYGIGCDVSGLSNIVAAELRAPFVDTTIVMVNTARYGGCGGSRAVYAAALSAAREIAVHELGHSLGGLADEYPSNSACGIQAGEVNTSRDAIVGAWPEWIEDLGAPREGAQYYQQCVYRPFDHCEMRSLSQPFCPVCVQHWSLVTFAHPRVAPTAPITSQSPESTTTAWAGVPVDFSVSTRLSSGDQVSNLITWSLTEPDAVPHRVIATDTPSITHVFEQTGDHTLEVRVVADANFVKRVKDGANVDVAVWEIDVAPLAAPPEVSAPGSPEPLRFPGPTQLAWEDASGVGSFGYNVYRGELVDLASHSYGDCLQSNVAQNSTQVPAAPPQGSTWCYLVSGVNPAGEGPLGQSSEGDPRASASACD